MTMRDAIKDPASGNVVRFTDNGPKEGDYMPEIQYPMPVELGSDGKPVFFGAFEGDGPEAPVDVDLIEEDPEDDDR